MLDESQVQVSSIMDRGYSSSDLGRLGLARDSWAY